MNTAGLKKLLSSTPPSASTRAHSRHTGAMSGTYWFDTGCTMRSKLAPAKRRRSRMSPCTVARCKPSRSATMRSFASCCPDKSKTVTCAPAAASTGACCPPAPARHRIRLPCTSPSQPAGKAPGVKWICHCPARAAAMVARSTGCDHGLFCTAWASQAC
ncbi:hypothetical protein D3C81_1490600 [compost metagenome]